VICPAFSGLVKDIGMFGKVFFANAPSACDNIIDKRYGTEGFRARAPERPTWSYYYAH
jgi:hypothetical protein